MTSQDVLDFWFHESTPQQRFQKNADFDDKIRTRFLDLYRQVVAGETTGWRRTPEGRLAEILVLDQFSRNMFRDRPEAFAADGLALRLAQEAVQAGDDLRLPVEQRSFVYMPYMHSEDAAVHQAAVKLFSQPGLEDSLKYEYLHKSIIDRFGRYPHRNRVLGRKSTPEELEFLNGPNSSF